VAEEATVRGVDMIGEEYEVPEVLRAGGERWELKR